MAEDGKRKQENREFKVDIEEKHDISVYKIGPTPEDFAEGVSNLFSDIYKKSLEKDSTLESEILTLAEKDPSKIKSAIANAYENSLKFNPFGDNQYMRTDPNESITSPVYNAVGSVYNSLGYDAKISAIKGIAGIMDFIRYDYVQISHTPLINSPELVADLCVARDLYWPGKGRHKYFLEGSLTEVTPNELIDLLLDEKGDFKKEVAGHFFTAYAALHKDVAGGVLADKYYSRANPAFLERVLKAIAQLSTTIFFKNREEFIEHINGSYEKNAAERIIEYSKEIDPEHIKKLRYLHFNYEGKPFYNGNSDGP